MPLVSSNTYRCDCSGLNRGNNCGQYKFVVFFVLCRRVQLGMYGVNGWVDGWVGGWIVRCRYGWRDRWKLKVVCFH